jgi:hypothetical protein
MGDKNEVTVHKSALEAIGKVLHEDAYSYSGDGSPADLGSRGNVTVAQLGNYPAGQGYAKSLANAHASVGGEAYTNFITAYKQAVSAIEQTVQNYHGAEDATEQSAKKKEQSAGASNTQQV